MGALAAFGLVFLGLFRFPPLRVFASHGLIMPQNRPEAAFDVALTLA
jgi:hypothetical protein